MSEWLREAMDTDRWDDVDVVDTPDVSDVYADYISASDYEQKGGREISLLFYSGSRVGTRQVKNILITCSVIVCNIVFYNRSMQLIVLIAQERRYYDIIEMFSKILT